MPKGTRAIKAIGPPIAAMIVASTLGHGPAAAERLANGIAVFAALDKVTARISRLEIKIDETQAFGALRITPRVCYTRPPTEPPKTTAYVEVEETKLDQSQEKIFSGWMFAQNPGLNAVQHPVFDVWLTDCNARPEATAESTTEGEVPKIVKKKRRVKRR